MRVGAVVLAVVAWLAALWIDPWYSAPRVTWTVIEGECFHVEPRTNSHPRTLSACSDAERRAAGTH